MKKVWTSAEIQQRLLSAPRWLSAGVLAIYHRHIVDEQQGFSAVDAPTGIRLGRLLMRGLRLTDLPAYQAWAQREMLKYASWLTRIANGEG